MSWLNRKNCFLFVLFVSAFAVLTACSGPDGNAENGKRWYAMHSCNGCHGNNGNDGRSPDISNLNWSFGRFEKRLRKANDVTMPAFPESEISKQDAADLYAYIKTL